MTSKSVFEEKKLEHDNIYGLACDDDECKACQVEREQTYEYTCPHTDCFARFIARYDAPPEKCPVCDKQLTWWPNRG